MTGPDDTSRREFFRRFAGDLVSSAAQLTRAVNDLRDQSASEAAALLSDGTASGSTSLLSLLGAEDPRAVATAGPAGGPWAGAIPSEGAAPTGFRTPFRMESDDVVLLVDQRRLPDALVEVPVRGAPEGARAIRR